MKESGKENLKPTIYDKTLSTAGAVPLPHAGKAYMEAASPRIYGAMPESGIQVTSHQSLATNL